MENCYSNDNSEEDCCWDHTWEPRLGWPPGKQLYALWSAMSTWLWPFIHAFIHFTHSFFHTFFHLMLFMLSFSYAFVDLSFIYSALLLFHLFTHTLIHPTNILWTSLCQTQFLLVSAGMHFNPRHPLPMQRKLLPLQSLRNPLQP